jgi:hypothetical protein
MTEVERIGQQCYVASRECVAATRRALLRTSQEALRTELRAIQKRLVLLTELLIALDRQVINGSHNSSNSPSSDGQGKALLDSLSAVIAGCPLPITWSTGVVTEENR